ASRKGGPSRRAASPRGGSILTTSAPRSPRIWAQKGPATTIEKSTTATPCSGPIGAPSSPARIIRRGGWRPGAAAVPTGAVWAVLVALWLIAPGSARAEEAQLPAGDEIARRVNERDEGHQVSRAMAMELVEKDGSSRTRLTRSFRRDFGDERRSVLFFEDPPNLKGTALLSFDYAQRNRQDDQWLYLPALRRARRIATSERGRAFLGTDFSFEDMRKETRLSLDDYRWRTAGSEEVEGRRCWVLEGIPVDDATARQLGYGRLR